MIPELFTAHVKLALSRVDEIELIFIDLLRLLAGRLCEEVILYTPAVLGSVATTADGKFAAPSTSQLMNTFSDDAKAAKDKAMVDYSEDFDNYNYDYSKAIERSFLSVFISLTITIF